MHAFACAYQKTKCAECLSQYFLHENAAQNAFTAQIHIRRRRRVGGDPFGTLEVIVIMAASPAKCQCHAESRFTSACNCACRSVNNCCRSAKDSVVIQMLNPPQQFPGADLTVRAFDKPPMAAKTCMTAGASPCIHPTELGGAGFSPQEFYRLILGIDMGGQFFSRENKDSATNP